MVVGVVLVPLVLVVSMMRVAAAAQAPSPPADAADADASPWRADPPVTADGEGGVFSATGGARIDLPPGLVGGTIRVELLEGDVVRLYPESPEGPEAWPSFAGSLYERSARYGAAVIPVYTETLWVGAEGPWRVAIQEHPVEWVTEEADSGWTPAVLAPAPVYFVVPGPASSATLYLDQGDEVFLEVIGPEGLDMVDVPQGARELAFSWPPGPFVVVRVDAELGNPWRIVVDGASGAGG